MDLRGLHQKYIVLKKTLLRCRRKQETRERENTRTGELKSPDPHICQWLAGNLAVAFLRVNTEESPSHRPRKIEELQLLQQRQFSCGASEMSSTCQHLINKSLDLSEGEVLFLCEKSPPRGGCLPLMRRGFTANLWPGCFMDRFLSCLRRSRYVPGFERLHTNNTNNEN